MTKNTQSAPVAVDSAPAFEPSLLASQLGVSSLDFSAGKGEAKLHFSKPLADATLAQVVRAFTYGCKRVYNDYRNPLLAKVKEGTANLPEGVQEDDEQGLFDYWWANIFGQVHTRASSGPTGTPAEKQAVSEYLASRPAAFGALYAKIWADPTKLTPKGKPSAKPRPASLTALQECLTAIAGGTLTPEKWSAVRADVDTRKAAILKARADAEANAQAEGQAPEDLF